MISIIIPVYNTEKYLKKCIDSILGQSYPDYEVILIDDGSTDASGKMCDGYRDNRKFKILHQTNQGVSVARNNGLSVAEGDYVLFVDPDDWIADNALETLMTNIGDADLVLFSYVDVYEDREGGMTFCRNSVAEKHSDQYTVSDPYFEILGKSGMLCNKLYKRSAIGDVLFDKDMSYGEDTYFIVRILGNVHTAKIVDSYLYYYFHRKESVVSEPVNARSFEYLENTKKVYEICSRNKQPVGGIKRIVSTIVSTISKIPLTHHDIKSNAHYIRECKSLLRVPSLSEYALYFTDKRIPFNDKRLTVLLFFEPLYLYYRLLKNRRKEKKG